MVDQTDLAMGAETRIEHVGDIVGFAQEHALLAVAAEGQGVQLDRRRGGRNRRQCLIKQTALSEQAEFESVGQQFAVGITHALAVDPGAAHDTAVGEHQCAAPRITVVVESTDIKAAIGQVQATLTAEAPVAERTDVMATVGTDQFALAGQRAFLELAQPDVAVGVFVAALAVQLIVLEATDIDVAVSAVERTVAFKLTVDEMAGERIAAGITALAFAIGFAVGELALIRAAVIHFETAEPGILISLEFATVGHGVFFQRAFAVTPALFEAAGVTAGIGGQAALTVEQPPLELAAIDLAITAMPFALPMPLPLVELPGVPAAVGVVDTSLTLQQAIDQLAAIASAVRQARIRGQQRFAVAASGKQQGQGKGCKTSE